MNAMQKDQIHLLRIQGTGYSKIAQSLGLSENTVKSYCKRNMLGGVVVSLNNNTAEMRFCKNCGTQLSEKKGAKPKKFCCDKCRTEWWNSHFEAVKKKAVYTLICSQCGKSFESYGNKKRKYCCHPCYIAGRFKGVQGKEVNSDCDNRKI